MRRLYLGNTTSDTDHLVTKLAQENNTVNHGLITCADDIVQDGFYHTTIIDISRNELQKITCDIELLDQPKETYSTIYEYYKTLEWVQGNNYWQQLVLENKSFCIFPFINHSLKKNVSTVCCRSDVPISLTKDFDWQNSTKMNQLRNSMLAGERVDYCKTCYSVEDAGLTSARQSQTIDWAYRLGLDNIEDISYNKPVMYDVFPNNNCNQMCRMCKPDWSILIQREQNITTTSSVTNWDYIDVKTAQVVYIAGGEPTAMIEFIKFLDRCIENNRTDLEIRINTNASKISEKLFKKLEYFSNIKFTVSIDGYHKANEYQRWLSDWKDVTTNISRIVSNGHSVNFNITLSIYTVHSLADLVVYLDKHYNNHIVSISYASFKNNILDPFIIDYSIDVIQNLETTIDLAVVQNNPILKKFLIQAVDKMKNSTVDIKRLEQFFKYNDNLDAKRNSSLADYLPDLESKRKLL